MYLSMIAISHIIIYNCGEEFFEHLQYEHYHVKQMFHTNCTALGKGTVGQYKMHLHTNTMTELLPTCQ
jgi:hypothetical protein